MSTRVLVVKDCFFVSHFFFNVFNYDRGIEHLSLLRSVDKRFYEANQGLKSRASRFAWPHYTCHAFSRRTPPTSMGTTDGGSLYYCPHERLLDHLQQLEVISARQNNFGALDRNLDGGDRHYPSHHHVNIKTHTLLDRRTWKVDVVIRRVSRLSN